MAGLKMTCFWSMVFALVCVAAAADKPSFLGKSYKLSERCDNFDDFMEALGVGWFTRKAGNLVFPTVTVTYDDASGFYTMKTESAFRNQELKFKLGEEFDEETPDGRNVKATITIDGNKMMHVQKGDLGTTIERVFGDEKMVATMKFKDITCVRTYKLDN